MESEKCLRDSVPDIMQKYIIWNGEKQMDGSMFIGTWWALIPPLLAIILAFVTKEVYSSLFIGVAVGAVLYSGFHPWNSFVNFFEIMKSSMNLNKVGS